MGMPNSPSAVDSPKRDVDLCKIAVASKKSAVYLENVVDFVHNLQ
jgi:hypothetical protein